MAEAKNNLLTLCLLIATSMHSSAQISYTVSFPNPNTHYVQVDMVVSGLKNDSIDIKMPVWIPGSYMVREYSKNVEGFQVHSMTNEKLRFDKVRKNVWRIYSNSKNEIKISYQYYAYELTVRTCFVNHDKASLNGAALFMYADEFMNMSSDVKFVPYNDWKEISTGMPIKNTDKWVRRANNFDELADSPVVIGNQEILTFDYKGIPHRIAMVGKADYDGEKVKKDFYKIVDECNKIFDENPLKDYTFIIYNLPTGSGGLEHMNSSCLMNSKKNYTDDAGYKVLLSLAAHEYFHLWVAKRIRPFELGPFDYENEVYTRQLWFLEGFSSFYDDYLVYKAGFFTEEEYLDVIKGNMKTALNTPGDKFQSLSEASFDAWIKYYRRNENSLNSTVSYYVKGGLVAIAMNLDIINTSKGEKTADDVLRYLYSEYYKKLGRGITDLELQNAFESVTGKDYDSFFEKYIHGTEPFPYEEYFQMAGISIDRVDGMKEPVGFLGATFIQSGDKTTISFVERNSPAWSDGLDVNDIVLGVDDQQPVRVKDYLNEKKPGDKVIFKILRFGDEMDIEVVLAEPTAMDIQFSKIRKPTTLQKKVQDKFLPAAK